MIGIKAEQQVDEVKYFHKAWRVTPEKAAKLFQFDQVNSFYKIAKRERLAFIKRDGKRWYRVDDLPLLAKKAFYLELKACHEKTDVPGSRYQSASASMRARADRRLEILRDWECYRSTNGNNSDDQFVTFARIKYPDMKISRPSLYNWRKSFQAHGIDGLIDNYSREPKRVASFSEEAKAYLADLYLDERRRDVGSCVSNLRAVGKPLGWEIPSYATCRRYLETLSRDVVLLLREGKKAFEDQGFPAIQRDHESVQPGELYVADDRMIDVSHGQGRKDERVWITVWMDFRTKKVLSVMFPKNGNNFQAVLDGFYEAAMQHIPNDVYLDNGGNYKVAASLNNKDDQALPLDLRAPIAKLLGGQNIHWAISENARTKLVERIFADMARIHDKNLTGYTGPNMLKRPEGWYIEKQNGFLERQEVIALVRKYFFEIHNNRAPEGKDSPNQLWSQHFSENAFRRADGEYLRHILLRTWPKPLKVRTNGIQFGKQSNGRDRFYWAEEFQVLARNVKEVLVKYHENEPQHIWIYHLDGTPICELPLYRHSQVPVIRAGEQVGEYFSAKRKREKEIKAMKERLDDLHGVNFTAEELLKRDDLTPEPEENVDKVTGEVLETVETIPLSVVIPPKPETFRQRFAQRRRNQKAAEDALAELIPETQVQTDAWDRLLENL